MARIVAFSRVPVKANRKSSKPAAPFGAGLLCHTKADEDWLAMHSFDPHEPTDAQWEAMALQAAWDAMWEGSEFGPEKCACCGDDAEGELTAGLCDACATAIDADLDRDRCLGCGRPDDFLDPQFSLCPPCMLAAEEASTRCQTGQRRVY